MVYFTDYPDTLQASLEFSNSQQQDLVGSPGGFRGQESRGGVFVMYNCARLNTLLGHFEKAVQEGRLPDFWWL